jgi:hypothetical protein
MIGNLSSDRPPRGPSQPPEHDVDLAWLLLQGASVMRERGTTAGIVNILECGGFTGGSSVGQDGCYVHPFTDQQLGWGAAWHGDIERHRWLTGAWLACQPPHRNLLILRHVAPRAAFRSDEGYGAPDRFVEGLDGRQRAHGAHRTGVEAQLGELAAVALAIFPLPGDLLAACHAFSGDARSPTAGTQGKQAGYGRTIRRALRQARDALEPAWAEWWESKGGADPMRRRRR